MLIEPEDLWLLSKGQPPQSDELLAQMTLSRHTWLDYIHDPLSQKLYCPGGEQS
jgi:hypothetical protein